MRRALLPTLILIAACADGPTEVGLSDEVPVVEGVEPLAAPVVDYLGYELGTGDQSGFRYYRFEIANFGSYDPELFSPAPELPPCGLNPRASRTWVHTYLDGSRAQGYCGLVHRAEARRLWTANRVDEPIPRTLGVELWDRATDRRSRTDVPIDPDLVYGAPPAGTAPGVAGGSGSEGTSAPSGS